MTMPPPANVCPDHSGVCSRVKSLEARMSDTEDSVADLHDRTLVSETRAAKSADVFGRYIWPVLLVIVTSLATRYLTRQEPPKWQEDYSHSRSQSQSASSAHVPSP